MKKFIAVLLILTLTVPFFAACDKNEVSEYDPNANYIAEIDIKGYGTITVKLDSKTAPITVENFVNLALDGFYDGLTFHRIIPGFMCQGGDPEGTGMGGSSKNIRGEFAANGFSKNTLSHERGVISMARSQNKNSASSQFFICFDDCSFLHKTCSFGDDDVTYLKPSLYDIFNAVVLL